MNKYSNIEIQTAKNLLEKGYKWIVRDSDIFGSNVYAYAEKPYKELYGWQQPNCCECVYICSKFASIFQSIHFGDKEPVSLESIVHPQILDDAERQYLSAVIKPFKDKVKYIQKFEGQWSARQFEQILIQYYDEITRHPVYFALTRLGKGTMYEGMERGHKYTPEELGL